MLNILTKLFGSRNDRLLKELWPIAKQVSALEADVQDLSDEELAAKTVEFRQRLSDGATTDELLPEAFAVVREASHRVLGMRHFDAQIIGGIILHQGKIAEMKTGEGKTLTATLAVYLNALSGKGSHVVTVNDYLASRDAEQMGKLYGFLGLSTGVIVHGITNDERRDAYASDITYGTNNEFGFDYLRDNMAFSSDELVQRGHHFAIVDEVDSILIDESRTPLIISGPAEQATELYVQADGLIKQLAESDYEKDEKDRAVSYTETGNDNVEKLFRDAGLLTNGSLYDPENVNLMHAATQALRANTLFARESDYIVRNDEVIIIDEFTGRMMPGRRYSDGLHQALEAKEGVTVQPENQTLASITFQNFFRMYDKLAGMTGTADTEAEEFQKIYKLEVVIVPTNRDMIRNDVADVIYRDAADKFEAIVSDIEVVHQEGAPLLVGTTSIDKSELLSEMLKKKGIKHEVLNAKHHEREAEIVSQAGRKGAVTIATNMAGRGTDIMLGGNPDMLIAQLPAKLSEADREAKAEEIRTACAAEHIEVVELGGLHILGTERHESRRIDNQLRGRSGRQGDPGTTRFYLSLEDDLMRIFGGEKMQSMLTKMGFEKGEAIEHPWVTKAIENSQKKVEGRNFDVRKNLLEYDDVMNQQRDVTYSQRRELLQVDDVHDVIEDMQADYAGRLEDEFLDGHIEEWRLDELQEALKERLSVESDPKSWLESDEVETAGDMTIKLAECLKAHMAAKEEITGAEQMRGFEKYLVLQILDHHWKEHLLAMDHLRQSVGLRGYAQKQPIQEYKRESFELFEGMLDKVREETMTALHRVQVEQEAPIVEQTAEQQDVGPVNYSHGDDAPEEESHTYKREHPKVGRNEPCPCGSGKKYKQCHGKHA
ncbi:preprotein translocase subunit SecA [Mariprofundus micogutta]|uniref:Protein translocase subunit SecA n=1 Tax=Mariprofundus micogutta TaxID=1921010 RepID=A0A1L8CMF2_9PROT|nr:preprotein translocase subunit SecA [Mariprofundus micogutta]GAV20087.1 preprotein translocase subunit SecA [Mariprofundus micogutta]